MSVEKVSQKTSMFIALCLLSSFVAAASPSWRAQSEYRVDGYIQVQVLDRSGQRVKLHFVFDEETGSGDIHERSNSSLIVKMYNISKVDYQIPIHYNDLDWILVGTNNVTLWHWRLEKTYFLFYNSCRNPFPFEVYNVTFGLATDKTRKLSALTDIRSFSAEVPEVSRSSGIEGYPYLQEFGLRIFHNADYREIVVFLYFIIILVIVLGPLLFVQAHRHAIKDAIFFRISSSLLLFAPVLFFTFQTSIAPPYLTEFDWLCFIAAFAHGILMLLKILLSKPKGKNR